VIIRYYAQYVAQVVGHFVVLLASPVNLVVLFHIHVSQGVALAYVFVQVGVPQLVVVAAAPDAVYGIYADAGTAV